MVTKRNVLLVSAVAVLIAVGLTYPWKIGLCGSDSYGCINNIQSFSTILDIFFPTLILSLVTFKLRQEIFQAWMRYALWWVPLTVVLTLIAPNDRSQSIPFPSTKGMVDLGLVTIFVIVSIGIILYKWSPVKK